MASGDRRATGRVNVPTGVRAANPHPNLVSRPAPAITWEQFFPRLTPEQQSELLALAGRQGFIHAHQLPASSNGTIAQPAGALSESATRVLAGHADTLTAVRPGPLTVHDTALDAAQQAAVARAISSTDISLIQGLPGTGKSRVIAEILNQTAQRGERVLVLGRTTASADRILELIDPCASILTLRLLAPGETVEQLPPASRSATFAERLRAVGERGVNAVRASQESLARECRTAQQMATVWTQLQEIADRLNQLKLESEETAHRRATIGHDVERDPVFAENERYHQQWIDKTEAAISETRDQLAAHEDERKDLSRRIDELRPLADARTDGRWWTPAWWKARRHAETLRDMPSWLERLNQLSNATSDAEKRIEQLEGERVDASRKYARERERQIAEGVARRRGALDDQAGAIRRERDLLTEKWRMACAALPDVKIEPSGHAVKSEHAAWQEALGRKELMYNLLKKWAAHLEQSNPWPLWLRRCAPVVVAPVAALAAGSADETTGFDLLILQEAEQFSEAEVTALVRRARRSVLVGEPRPGGFLERMWRILHWDPTSLPYAWTREAGRLCCRLRPVAPEHRGHLERESVADFPDIELRILSLPRGTPTLAEVAFPPSLSLAEAKSYIYRELEELAIEAAAGNAHWTEELERITLRFGHDPIPVQIRVALEPGVTELLSGAEPLLTCGIDFDRVAGWDLSRAEAWVQHRLGGRELGRTARLDVAHRLHPHLAAFVAHVAYGNGAHAGGLASLNGCAPRVEFVPVPALRELNGPARGKPAATPRAPALSRKGGAGLEIDLSDPRQRPRLPMNLLTTLPGKGVVNVAEAQVIVRWLQAFAAKNDVAEGASICVMAMDPAQVQLLRGLIRQTPSLLSASMPIVIDTPAALREREFSIVILSLTRSHSHRAIAFSDGPDTLPLALTRGKSRLVIFGDAGSLARRSEWDGPLEHLDEQSAGRERELVGRLVEYLEGHGACPSAFRLCEVAGA